MGYVPALYEYHQVRLKEHSQGKMLSRSFVEEYLTQYRVANPLKKIVIAEMEAFGLIKIEGDRVHVINCKIDTFDKFSKKSRQKKIYNEMIHNRKSIFDF